MQYVKLFSTEHFVFKVSHQLFGDQMYHTQMHEALVTQISKIGEIPTILYWKKSIS